MKYAKYLILLTLALQTIGAVEFKDEFNSSISSFPEFRNEKGFATIQAGKYIVDAVANDSNSSFKIDAERYVDFTKDFEIKIKLDYVDHTFRFFWADGKGAFHIFIKEDELSVYFYDGEWNKKAIRKIKNEFEISSPFELKIVQKNKLCNISISQNSFQKSYFSGDLLPKIGNIKFGFMAPNYETSSYVIDEFSMTYVPFVPDGKKLVDDIDHNLDRINLGEIVNSEWSEVNPRISIDGKKLYFIKKRKYDNLFYSELRDGFWSLPRLMKYPLNAKRRHSILASVAGDENMIYLVGVYKNNTEYLRSGISYSERTNKSWSDLKEIKADLPNKKGNLVSYFLSADNKYLISSLQNDQCIGGDDLFVSFLQADGTFSDIINLGKIINTPDQEGTPFLAADNETLYFSSNGYGGYGSNDIFITRRLDDTWQNWTEPENLGPVVNSTKWDAYYSLDAQGKYAYLASSLNSYGSTDIYKVELSESSRPKPVALVSGKVLNSKNNEPIEAKIEFKRIGSDEIAGSALTNQETGEFKLTLPYGNKYEFFAIKDGFFPVSENIDLSKLDEFTEISRDIYLTPIQVGESIRLNNIFFESGKYELLPESFTELDRLIEFLELTNYSVEISGHTDNVGSDADNQTLSQNRAQAVVNYLINNGISKDRLLAKGYGESIPQKNNDTKEGRAYNRRVEFKILK